MDDMVNLFGAEYEAPPACSENACATKQVKAGKKESKGTSTGKSEKLTDDTELDIRKFQVKIYNEVYDYVAPADKEKVTISDVRQWLVSQGYTELTKDRAAFTWVTPDEGAKMLVAGVKFEKMG